MKYTLLFGTVLSLLFVVQTTDLSSIDLSNLENQLPDDLSKSNLTENVVTLFKDKCIQVAGEEVGKKAFAEIETEAMKLAECANNLVNFTAIQGEINKASPTGDLELVFNKYCLKRPEALECISNFNSKLTPCLDKEEREHQEVFLRIMQSLLNFICYKGGDQIALFVAEKGPECLESNKEEIQNCINSTFSGYLPEEGIENVKTLPKLVMGAKQCKDLERLETCIIKKLETCVEITPANIAESMFRFIKNETICRSIPNTDKQIANKGDGISTTSMISLNCLSMVLFFTVATYLNRRTIV